MRRPAHLPVAGQPIQPAEGDDERKRGKSQQVEEKREVQKTIRRPGSIHCAFLASAESHSHAMAADYTTMALGQDKSEIECTVAPSSKAAL